MRLGYLIVTAMVRMRRAWLGRSCKSNSPTAPGDSGRHRTEPGPSQPAGSGDALAVAAPASPKQLFTKQRSPIWFNLAHRGTLGGGSSRSHASLTAACIALAGLLFKFGTIHHGDAATGLCSAALLLPGLLIHDTPTSLRGELALAGLAGLVMWRLIEYAMHRFEFHGVQPFQSLHAEHHRWPLALIATPTHVSVTLIVVLVWLPATFMAGSGWAVASPWA